MTQEEKNFGMYCHLASLAGFVGIPLGNILGPLIVWLVKKDQMSFVDACGKEVLNFQISMTIYFVISAILTIVCIGYVALLVLLVLDLVYTIQAAMQTNQGNFYRYPMTIRFIK